MRDISTRQDIENLIDEFYEKVIQDEKIGVFFTEIVQLDWNTHIPVMYDFWESLLFGKHSYQGNPMHTHNLLNRKKVLEVQHFERWLDLWQDTILENFSGEKADEAMMKARNIAGIMKIKIENSNR
ncbi:group III truncated hemoglobin [Gramella sp. BOM4]|nr:group III truncated hemoglobin [Christiangramia bathymodioli]